MDFNYDQEVAETFGPHARALLNDYSCYLEDIILEHVDDLSVRAKVWRKMCELKAYYIPVNNIKAFPR